MKLMELLNDESEQMIDDAVVALRRARLKHYEEKDETTIRARVATLYRHTVESIGRRDLTNLVRYADAISRIRYEEGFGLRELQTAFNVLEEAIWRRVLKCVDDEEIIDALGLVSTALGVGKDRLACSYLEHARGIPPASLDQRALFSGTENRHPVEERVVRGRDHPGQGTNRSARSCEA
ncbi:MAG: hypothetical protein V2A76_03795 [Planctomycetota bacterium]